MFQARCRQVLIGLESPEPASLNGLEMKGNFKARRWAQYKDAVRRIQDHGITVNGCFILGLDGHTPDLFRRVYEFAMDVPLYEVQITVLTPFPGTPLYNRLEQEERLLEPRAWRRCTLFDVNFRPKQMSADDLRGGLYWLSERLYNAETVQQRRRQFFHNLRRKRRPMPEAADDLRVLAC
jgi:radical SAM superfamily enzyme YgiQ (UPF0313 family)